MKTSHAVLAGIVLVALICLAHELDYRIQKAEQRITYSHPPMETPCREPKVNAELRIWIDKRLSETEGVRTCRVVPINGEESLRKSWKKAMKL